MGKKQKYGMSITHIRSFLNYKDSAVYSTTPVTEHEKFECNDRQLILQRILSLVIFYEPCMTGTFEGR